MFNKMHFISNDIFDKTFKYFIRLIYDYSNMIVHIDIKTVKVTEISNIKYQLLILIK